MSTPLQLHIHIAGKDRSGILAEAIGAFVRFNWSVLDIKQFVFNGLLNLSILLEGEASVPELKQSLEDYGRRSGMNITVTPWNRDLRPDEPYSYRSVVTLLGKCFHPQALLSLTETFASMDINILRIEQLDKADDHVLEVIIGTREAHSSVEVLDALVNFKEKFQVDIAIQDDTLFRRNKRLIVFDADMTFLQCEIIDELGKMAGVGERMREITHRAMSGDVDFPTALRERVKLLKGLSQDKLEELAEHLPLTPGAEELVSILQHLNYKIAIVSGGFQYFIDKIKEKYRLDYGFANRLKIVDGKVTGDVEGDIIDARAKEEILVSLAKREGLSTEQVIAVGDGANDIHMLARAGLGIAFNAKPIVQKHARASINRSNLDLVLYFLGIDGKNLEELRRIVKRDRVD